MYNIQSSFITTTKATLFACGAALVIETSKKHPELEMPPEQIVTIQPTNGVNVYGQMQQSLFNSFNRLDLHEERF